MQARGTEHFHSAVHFKDAPTLQTNSKTEIINFINKHISCEITDIKIDKTLHKLVIARQTHYHTKTCKKFNLPCRFYFKRPPSDHTIITKPSTLTKEQIKDIKTILLSVMETIQDKQKNPLLQEILKQKKLNYRTIS